MAERAISSVEFQRLGLRRSRSHPQRARGPEITDQLAFPAVDPSNHRMLAH